MRRLLRWWLRRRRPSTLDLCPRLDQPEPEAHAIDWDAVRRRGSFGS